MFNDTNLIFSHYRVIYRPDVLTYGPDIWIYRPENLQNISTIIPCYFIYSNIDALCYV